MNHFALHTFLLCKVKSVRFSFFISFLKSLKNKIKYLPNTFLTRNEMTRSKTTAESFSQEANNSTRTFRSSERVDFKKRSEVILFLFQRHRDPEMGLFLRADLRFDLDVLFIQMSPIEINVSWTLFSFSAVKSQSCFDSFCVFGDSRWILGIRYFFFFLFF